MSVKLKVLSTISALCFLGSVACFSGYAAELLERSSGDEEVAADPGYTDPGYTDPGYTDPNQGGTAAADPTYTDPNQGGTAVADPTYTDPNQGGTAAADPTYTDPNQTGTVSVDPSYVDPNQGGTVSDAAGFEDPTQNYSATTGDLISDGNFPQADASTTWTTSTYVDYSSEYNQYIANTYQAQYDDNYFYVPSYTAPTESLIETSSKVVDTDELTADDWATIMLDLDDGSTNDGKNTFSFIKDNEDEGDTSMEWMLYLGVALILLSVFTVIFVIISTNKLKAKLNYA